MRDARITTEKEGGKEGRGAAQRDGERMRGMGSGAEKWRKKIQ